MGLKPLIVKNIERAQAEDIEKLRSFGVATVHEAYGKRGLMHGLSPILPKAVIAGSAVTCLNYAGDNLMIHMALKYCKPGDIVVAAVTAPSIHGMFGELLATAFRAHGVEGIIIDSGVRDTKELQEMGFPAWARGICASGTQKTGAGWVNIPVSCGSTVVMPGDVIVADADGVVVVERQLVKETIAACQRRIENEKLDKQELAKGRLTIASGGLKEMAESDAFEYF